MASTSRNILTIGYLNLRAQTGLPVSKQLQIEAFAKFNKCDILHLQEANIDEETFSSCGFLQNCYNIPENNSINKYGTASLVKSELIVDNIRCDTEGRIIIFDIGNLTLGNVYLQSGTDAHSRSSREKYCCEVLPSLLLNACADGCIGGDFNCIVNKKDATQYPEAKMSRGLQRLIHLKGWQDSFRTLYPHQEAFSRYYENTRAEGATRIDRNYHFGGLEVVDVKYLPVAFSDHFGQIVKISLPDPMNRILSPKSRNSFSLKAEVINDEIFRARLEEEMLGWVRVKNFQVSDSMGTLQWWELLVKPGIKKIGIQRAKEINKKKKEELNLLLLRQVYLVRKIQQGHTDRLGELRTVHLLMEKWYIKESEKVQHQSRVREYQDNEKTSIYHHEIHKKTIKKSSILKLLTPNGLIEGHQACSSFLENTVQDLLLHPAQLDHAAQQALLAQVEPVFTNEDNKKFLTKPTSDTVYKTVCRSNLHAAPGTDGLPSLLYKECWHVLGEHLTDVMVDIFDEKPLQPSMRTSLMVFGAKPKKPGSILPKDKRRISLLNSDFKTATGLEAEMMKETATHTLSHLQLVAGNDTRIHHGINMARNAIYAASKPGHPGCGILDTDLIAAFDYLCLDWTYQVLEKKGLDKRVISRLRNLYLNTFTIVVVNSTQGQAVKNISLSLRQGDLP